MFSTLNCVQYYQNLKTSSTSSNLNASVVYEFVMGNSNDPVQYPASILQSTSLLFRGLALWHIWWLLILLQNVSRAFVKMDKNKNVFTPFQLLSWGNDFLMMFLDQRARLKVPPELITTHKVDINTGNEWKIISRTKGKNIIMVLVLAFNFQIWITHFCHPTCLSEYLAANTITIDTIHFFRSLNNPREV